MSEITGVVQEIQTKPTSTGKSAYDIVVGGERYGVGFYPPKCKQGDYVKFELDESRGYKNVGRNTLRVSANKAPPEAVAAAAATMPAKNSAGMSVDNRQDVISRQAATNSAIAFLAVLASADALGLPAVDKKGGRIAAVEALLEKYTTELYEQNTGLKWKSISPATKGDTTPAEAPVEAAAPSDADWD